MHEHPDYRVRETHSPIFVLCHPHAYSSVATAVLGSHPDLYWFPELRLFNAHTVGEVLDYVGSDAETLRDVLDPGGDLEGVPVGEPKSHRMSGMVRTVAQLFYGSQSDAAIDRAWAWIRQNRSMSTAELFDRFLEKVAPKTGIEKSPETAATDGHLMLCHESFPRARFVHLVRHPLTATQSLREKLSAAHSLSGQAERSHTELNYRAARIWFSFNQRILRFTESLPPEQSFLLRAEWLLNQPADAAREFCRWAGLDASDESVSAMLHPEDSPYSRPGPAHAPGGEHGSFLENPTIRPVPDAGDVVVPKEWGLNSNEARGFLELANRLGYQ